VAAGWKPIFQNILAHSFSPQKGNNVQSPQQKPQSHICSQNSASKLLHFIQGMSQKPDTLNVYMKVRM
jgi:hypothetical protein